MNTTFDARQLWASMGMPYIEPDEVIPSGPLTHILTYADTWRPIASLSVYASIRHQNDVAYRGLVSLDVGAAEALVALSAGAGAGELSVDGSVSTP